MGDPHDERTRLGPLVREDKARRVEAWVGEAVAAGARVLCGGRRARRLLRGHRARRTCRETKVSCREVFGPVCTLEAATTSAPRSRP